MSHRPPKTRHPDSPIAARRLALDMTQEELAARIGVRLITVQRHEAMKVKSPPTRTTFLIAVVLKCTVEDLTGFHGERIIRDTLGANP